MSNFQSLKTPLLHTIADHLDVPKSYYEKAAARHRSLGEWLCRDGSTLAAFDPDVRPQGSFRYGTVIRPLLEGDEYDLDNVCLLKRLTMAQVPQAELKRLFGEEIKAYAKEHGMLKPASEHHRCWRLHYADEVNFHLDTLPCLLAEQTAVDAIRGGGVEFELARRAIAITDRRHPHYTVVSLDWLTSNPRGFAAWFEQRAALGRSRLLAEGKARAEVEDVPPYEWKTTLQRSIQILKRHRDVMFRKARDLAPISMIITNLAANAYRGEVDLYEALEGILTRMPEYVRTTYPRVPNPTHPAEDYADKWAKDRRLEKNFREWHASASADLAQLGSQLGEERLSGSIESFFAVQLTADEKGTFAPGRAPSIVQSRPAVIASAPRPWKQDA